MQIPVVQKVLEANNLIAHELRSWFAQTGLLVVNLIGSPGSGKTSLVERTLECCAGRLKIGVIEGDPATALDAERIARYEAPVVQINTGGGCHLDAPRIRRALDDIDISGLDILIIENVGNLVCPSQFDLGETHKVLVCSLPEGDDKVLKYPSVFSMVSSVVLNKTDLAQYLHFDIPRFRSHVQDLNPVASLMEVSCFSGEGIDRWVEWLKFGIDKAQGKGGG